MTDTAEYTPPKVWTWDKASGGTFANINRPSLWPCASSSSSMIVTERIELQRVLADGQFFLMGRAGALSETNPSKGVFHGIFPFGPLGIGPSSRARCDAHGRTGED
jgi:hypothetical protein